MPGEPTDSVGSVTLKAHSRRPPVYCQKPSGDPNLTAVVPKIVIDSVTVILIDGAQLRLPRKNPRKFLGARLSDSMRFFHVTFAPKLGFVGDSKEARRAAAVDVEVY